MTTIDFTPPTERPRRNRIVTTGDQRIVHIEPHEIHGEWLPVPPLAPPDLRLTLRFGQEAGGWWAHIPELDITGEGDDLQGALSDVYSTAYDLLAYLREHNPSLAPELADQARYVDLLDVPGSSWFKIFEPAE